MKGIGFLAAVVLLATLLALGVVPIAIAVEVGNIWVLVTSYSILWVTVSMNIAWKAAENNE